jgi:hypothetical protein
MNIRKMSYNKRVTNKIRSACGPLIGDCEEWLNWGPTGRKLKHFENLRFGGTNSEKGYTRKHTGNRVTRWSFMFWGNLEILR